LPIEVGFELKTIKVAQFDKKLAQLCRLFGLMISPELLQLDGLTQLLRIN